MKFSEIVAQTLAWLQREGRVSYRALKREFGLDEEFLEDVKAELIDAKRVAVDEEGKVLVGVGKSSLESSVQSPESTPANLSDARPQTLDPRPISYTPPHLAERIRAEQAAQEESRNTQHEARAKLDEAHKMLSEVYNWFIEGFDTKDLQEAKELLAELGRTGADA